MDASWTLLGLPVEPEPDLAQPLEIAAVIKGFDAEGKVAYWTVSTPDLLNVEIIGMMTWGADVARYADA
jgi:hypothetical protein